LAYINVLTRTVLKTSDLTQRTSDGPVQVPNGLAINSSGFSFVPVQNGFLRASNVQRNKAVALQYTVYSSTAYNSARAELMCLKEDGRSFDILEEFGEQIRTSVTLADSVVAFVGIAP
jgi:hypothetical protein